MRHLQQPEFQVKALLLLVSQFAVGSEHDLQMACEILFAEQCRDALDALPLLTRYLQQGRVFTRDLRDGRITQEAHHLAREVCRAMALADEMVDLPQHFFACASSDCLHYFFENVRRRGADQVAHGISRELSAG